MAIKNKVLLKLKPKVVSFGFNREELEGVAAEVAANLEAQEDATDEDIDAAISAALPYLKLAQKQASRVIEDTRKKEQTTDPASKDTDGAGENPPPTKTEEGTPAWFTIFSDSMEKRFTSIEKADKAKSFSKLAEERFKEIDEDFYSHSLQGKEFQSEEEFEQFATKLEEGWGKFSQKLADNGLSKMAQPKGGGAPNEKVSPEVQSRIDAREKENTPSAIRGV